MIVQLVSAERKTAKGRPFLAKYLNLNNDEVNEDDTTPTGFPEIF